MTTIPSQSILAVAGVTVRFIIPRSDGVASRLPAPQERIVDSEGNVNFLAEADDETVGRWLKKLGSYLASCKFKPCRFATLHQLIPFA